MNRAPEFSPHSWSKHLHPIPRKIRELISDLRQAGFTLDRQKGSHRQFKHPSFHSVITLSGAEGDDPKTYQERQVTKAIVDSRSAP